MITATGTTGEGPLSLVAGLACSLLLHALLLGALEWLPKGMETGALSPTHPGNSHLRAVLSLAGTTGDDTVAQSTRRTAIDGEAQDSAAESTARAGRLTPSRQTIPSSGHARQAGEAETAPLSPLPAPVYVPSRDLDGKPGPLSQIEPEYPAAAAIRELAGSVVIRLYINERGTVDRVEVVRAQPEGVFEESARKAFMAARYTPGIKGGRAVKSLLVLEVSFEAPLTPPLPSGLGGQGLGK